MSGSQTTVMQKLSRWSALEARRQEEEEEEGQAALAQESQQLSMDQRTAANRQLFNPKEAFAMVRSSVAAYALQAVPAPTPHARQAVTPGVVLMHCVSNPVNCRCTTVAETQHELVCLPTCPSRDEHRRQPTMIADRSGKVLRPVH